MRRWIKRLTVLTVFLLLIGGGASWWLVNQTKHVPEFYERATKQRPEQTAEASKRMLADVKQLQEDAAKVGWWKAEFSDDEINAWLAEELPQKFPKLLANGASDPRVEIEDGRILAAVRYKNKRIDTVISCEVEVALTEQPNMLALNITQLKAGALPLPLKKFQTGISKEAATGDIDVQWDASEAGPIALITVPSEHPRYAISPVTVESVKLIDGSLVLSGHTGELDQHSYRPKGPIYRFVSFRKDRNRHKSQASLRSSVSPKLR